MVIGIVTGVVVLAAVAIIVVLASTSSHRSDTTVTASRSSQVDTSVTQSDGAANRGQARTDGSSLSSTTESSTVEPTLGVVVSAATLSPNAGDAAKIVQSYATALAHHDWQAARAVKANLGMSDDALQKGYGALRESTIVITGEGVGNEGSMPITGAYVAWEVVNGAQQTSIYCTRWDVNIAEGQILTEASNGPSQSGVTNGWADPKAELPAVVAACP